MTLGEHAGHFDIGITIASGGYVIYAVPRGDDHARIWATSVFTDIDLAIKYVERVMRSLEGPDGVANMFNEDDMLREFLKAKDQRIHGDDGTAGSTS